MQVRAFQALSRFPHLKELLPAICAVAKTGIGQPDGILADTSEYGEMVIFAVFQIDDHRHLQPGELCVACCEALRLEAKLRQNPLHVIKGRTHVCLIHRVEQLLFSHRLAVELVEQGGKRSCAAGIIEILLDYPVIAERFPCTDGNMERSRFGGEQNRSFFFRKFNCMGFKVGKK